TSSQTVRISQAGAGSSTWTATPSVPWIQVSPPSGNGPATLTITILFVPGLPFSGTTAGTIALAFTGTNNSPGPISVNLTTIPAGAGVTPNGSFDSPTDGTAGLARWIAVTGWALDDVEVIRVRVLRDPVPGEGAGLVFIGNATLVEGARPDVAALNPTRPRFTRAGWGYLLLTNFLPNTGNGTF